MKYQYLSNIPLDKAREDYLAFLGGAGLECREELLPVQEALGRVTARAVYARLCSPHYNAAAMDGVALAASRTFGATETTPVYLEEGEYVRVDTGDPLPEGCDAVVMIEDVVEEETGIRLYASATPWQHIRQIGEDVCAGDMLLPSFSIVTPAAIGAMLAGGVGLIEVLARPVVGILPTGDEVVPPSDSPGMGEVMEFNSAIFSGILASWGADSAVFPIVRDEREAVRTAVLEALEKCDCLLIGAGTSAGRGDHTTGIVEELGEVLYHGIAIKPGKPAVLARIGAKPVLGIPGYPVSGIIVMEELFKPVIYRMLRQPLPAPPTVEARLSKRVNSSLKYREFLRVRLSRGPDGLCAVPLNRGAGVVTSFVKADGILDIPQDSEGCEAGERVRLRLLRPMQEIEGTLSIVGSHDPLLDEAGDILRREYGLSAASSRVGSMGGVMAVKRRETTIAGIHLLDEDGGGYNASYVRRFFPEGDAVLLRCVKRVQGIMAAPGNPLGIGGFEDAVKLRYVNRQGGSGTRILCDYLLKRHGMGPERVRGYTREEFTHTAVAAQIAGGTADAGLGIYSAAKLYGLDFIPVCYEEYDLLLRAEDMDMPHVRLFLEVLRGEELRSRLEALGGYVLDGIGEGRAI